MKRYKFYPVSNFLEPIPSMKELALELGVTKATLSSYKNREKCVGKKSKPINQWFYIVDDSTTQEVLDQYARSVCADLRNEFWRPIFDGSYEVSNYGRVKSLKGKTPRILKQIQRSAKETELCVSLHINKVQKVHFVKRLVADAFVEKEDRSHLKTTKPPLEYVFKIDGVNTNNNATNLFWGDVNDMKRYGKYNGAGIPVIKLDPITGEELEPYDSMAEAASENYISMQGISLCILGGAITAGGYKWIVDEEWLSANI